MSKLSNGIVIYEGPSELNGKPIVAIATGFTSRSTNVKTGPMVQVWILDASSKPTDAWKDDSHVSVCGDCKHAHAKGNACYVNLGQGPNGIYKAWERGRYPAVSGAGLRKYFAGESVRFGAFGDPAAIPVQVLKSIVELIQSTNGMWTAYTHAWKYCDKEYMEFCVASVDNRQEYLDAKKKGWRTFRTLMSGEELQKGEFMCPATEEGRKNGKHITCKDCGACNGLNGKTNARGSAAIFVHGPAYVVDNYTNARLNAMVESKVASVIATPLTLNRELVSA